MPQIKIVNVEDYEPGREASSELLRLAGFEVFDAETGTDALTLVAQVKPQLVLLDVKLPDISGHEVCRLLKANDPTILILQISASLVSSPDRVRGLESGADAYLVKPVEPEELLATINALLRMRDAEDARRETEQRYELLFESNKLPTWICDLESFKFLAVNQAAVKHYGYSRDEFLSMRIPDIQPAEDVRAVEGDGATAPSTNASEWRHKKKDGTIIEVDVIWQKLLYHSRPAALMLANDITGRKRTDEEREQLLSKEQKAREEAETANRAKDEFLATVSHELRAPLNAMLGWAQILRSTRVDEKTLAHAIEIIERSARTQSKLIEDLLDTARIVSGKLRLDIQPIDLTSLIENAVEVLRPASEAKEIEISLRLNAGREVITGDPDRLQQVVWNLLSNAIKFTPKRGNVEVRLERADPHCRITVSDTGKGISPEYLPFIFDRFHQQDSPGTRRSGLGLGLSLVRHLVELHGGTVYAKSAGEGHGASFIINLPLRAVLPQMSEGEPPVFGGVGVLGAPSLEGLWVLVVDDEADARELVATLLHQCGARVTPVGSAPEALAVITAGEDGRRPDVLVSDVSMPEVDGYELVRRVRELGPESGGRIPAVALTAYGRSIDRIRALSAGFQMHMPKPVEPAELATVVASLTGLASTSKSRGA
ncbi:MAG TPA: response regulator [Blastocatellia bacterium]|nr:response regulator [Blastocatellia bacterium]